MGWMWGEESRRIKDNFHVFGLNNERTIRSQGRQGVKTGVRNEEYKSRSWRRRYFGHMKFEIMVGQQVEIPGRQWVKMQG